MERVPLLRARFRIVYNVLIRAANDGQQHGGRGQRISHQRWRLRRLSGGWLRLELVRWWDCQRQDWRLQNLAGLSEAYNLGTTWKVRAHVQMLVLPSSRRRWMTVELEGARARTAATQVSSS